MAHSLELLFDPAGDAAIRGIWRRLAEAGLPSAASVTAPSNRPHVTLLAATRIPADVDDVLRGLPLPLPVPCVVGAPLVFGGSRRTLARLIVPSAALLDLHEQVYRAVRPHLDGEPYPHCLPGHWTPHATLGRRISAEQAGVALAVDGVGTDLTATLVGLRRWDSDNRADHLLAGTAD